MPIPDFLEALEGDREFQLQVTGRRYIPPRLPKYMRLDLDERIRRELGQRGITLFYSHQVNAIDLIRQGENVVLMTPTASGKSLVYNVPVVESILGDPAANALYIFPLKGLEQDQFRSLTALASAVGIERPGGIYDGDTPAQQRKKIREALPNVIFTNPDMLHLALIPFHRKWKEFFTNLRYIVVDEIHSYRGVFGSNVGQVFRRLRRVCDHYGARPQYIAASATIANPGAIAEGVTGLPFRVVSENGSPSAGKYFLFINSVESPYTMATRLFVNCLKAGLRTIVFTKARKITELIYTWTLDYAPEFYGRISPYRSGFLPRERREIEARLFSGELLGVVSTSALELGVDIGGLDSCILCGYPGSVSSTWQRAGRVGRQGNESLVGLIAIDDALDRYLVRHPDEFFERSHEAATMDPHNRNIVKRHLVCAASEIPLRPGETLYDAERISPLIDELKAEGKLAQAKKGDYLISTVRRPQKDVGIRAVGERFMLVNDSGRHIGELSGGRVFREAFPGAIYLHKGRQYRVEELDIRKRQALCTEVKASYYTQPLSRETTEIIEEKETTQTANILLSWGRMRITQQVTGFDKKRIYDRVRISSHDLDMPEHVFETEGLWTVLDLGTKREIEGQGFDLGGTIHAVEHTSIACLPLFALCDRGDVGGLSHTSFPDFGLPAIFVYDGHDGGVGLSRRALEVGAEWLKATLGIIEECRCPSGCPSCVQDPLCGNRNHPLDKEGAKFLLRKWLS